MVNKRPMAEGDGITITGYTGELPADAVLPEIIDGRRLDPVLSVPVRL